VDAGDTVGTVTIPERRRVVEPSTTSRAQTVRPRAGELDSAR